MQNNILLRKIMRPNVVGAVIRIFQDGVILEADLSSKLQPHFLTTNTHTLLHSIETYEP